jgi:hypothetical protein
MILQFNGRIHLKGALPGDFDSDAFADKVHRYIHGVLIPSEGMTTQDIAVTEPPTVHIHASTEYDACTSCIAAAQDQEN